MWSTRVLRFRNDLMKFVQLWLTRRILRMAAAFLVISLVSMSLVFVCMLAVLIGVFDSCGWLCINVRRLLARMLVLSCASLPMKWNCVLNRPLAITVVFLLTVPRVTNRGRRLAVKFGHGSAMTLMVPGCWLTDIWKFLGRSLITVLSEMSPLSVTLRRSEPFRLTATLFRATIVVIV